jgi:riboflavin kinase/FMN adenylyltransferase
MTILHTSLDDISSTAQDCVLAIGNFDGVHLGHRALVGRARALATTLQAPLGIITFEPHPRQFFQPAGEPFRLTLLPMKQRLLSAMGVDHIFALPFNQELAAMTAEDFIEKILVQRLTARMVAVGENFAFGRNKGGTAKTLDAAARAGKFKLSVITSAMAASGEIYSSTAIRALLRQGQFEAAEKLLGWPWQIEAPVVAGDKRGRTIGFPTANQNVPDYVHIPFGIYAVRVCIEGETQWRAGVANFGIRPMFKIAQPIFETFIFEFDGDIYGKSLRVQPVRHLRAEASFQDLAALVAQMKEDCIAAKAVLKSTPALSA